MLHRNWDGAGTAQGLSLLMTAPFDNALTAPAVARNRDPILAVLREVLPAAGTVLEIASGTGEHAVHFAAALPHLVWQPTRSRRAGAAQHRGPCGAGPAAEPASAARTGCRGRGLAGHARRRGRVDQHDPHRAVARRRGTDGGGRAPASGGRPLYLYGPYRLHGQHTAPSNAAFDESLKARDPAWGVRDLEEVVALAGRHGLALQRTVAMPANNLSVIFIRSP